MGDSSSPSPSSSSVPPASVDTTSSETATTTTTATLTPAEAAEAAEAAAAAAAASAAERTPRALPRDDDLRRSADAPDQRTPQQQQPHQPQQPPRDRPLPPLPPPASVTAPAPGTRLSFPPSTASTASSVSSASTTPTGTAASPAGKASTGKTTAVTTTTTPRRRSFLSRFALPFRAPARTVADFHIRPAEPHRKYVAGDHVLGAVVLAVLKPLRITHLTVSLRGLVRVFKDANAAAAAAAAATTTGASSSASLSASASSSPSLSLSSLAAASASPSSSYLGHGHALLFCDEVVLSGTGRLEPGNYVFEFDLLFPDHGLPSSIDFERGSIAYVVTATLTRPTTVAPIQSCERKVYLVDPVDIGAVPKPRPRTISLEPISRKSKKRKVVVTTVRPAVAAAPATPTTTTVVARPASTTLSFASGTNGGGGGNDVQGPTLSDRSSARGSAHEPVSADESVVVGGGGAVGVGDHQTGVAAGEPRRQQPGAPSDVRSEISGGSMASVVSVASGTSVGSGGGANGTAAAAHVPNGTYTTMNTSSTTVGHHPQQQQHHHHQQQQQHWPTPSLSSNNGTAVYDDRTITATIEVLKGGCLPGDVVSVKVSVQHVKRIKSLHGVVVTLYRQGRIDAAPPEALFPRHQQQQAEEEEEEEEGDEGNGAASNGNSNYDRPREGGEDSTTPAQPKKKKKRQKEPGVAETTKLGRVLSAKSRRPNGDGPGSIRSRTSSSKDRAKDRRGRDKTTTTTTKTNNGAANPDSYYPKSKTGLGGLSLSSAGSCSVFRKDLSQSFSPLIIDPRTLQSSVTTSVRVPEDAFATIKGVPGDMISFKYQVEVIVDLGGKLASLLQSGSQSGGAQSSSGGGGGGGGGGPAGNIGNGGLAGYAFDPYSKPLGPAALLWGAGGGGSHHHMVDTDQLRRQKGVIYVAFEVVVGTADSSRQRGRGLGLSTTAPSVSLAAADGQQQQQQQVPPPGQRPHPYPSTLAGDWYPEDRKDPQQPIPANGGPSGAGPSTTGTVYHHHYHHHQPPPPSHQPYYDPRHTYDYSGHTNHYNDDYYRYTNGDGDHNSNSNNTASAQAPEYVPTPAMVAAADVNGLSEKERIRRAEERLLPSQPGGPSQTGGRNNGVGDGGPVGFNSYESYNNNDDDTGAAADHAPSVPTLDDLEGPLPAFDHAGGGPSAPTTTSLSSSSAAAYHPPPPAFPAPAMSALPAEDKQELERRRLLAEASAPPDFPADWEDGGGSGSGGGAGGSSSTGARRPADAAGSNVLGPSAPVLDEDSYGNGRAEMAPYLPSSSSVVAAAAAAWVPTDDVVSGGGGAAAASAASPAHDHDHDHDHGDGDEEDRYGRHYTYGPGTAGAGLHGGSAAGAGEPLPRYER